MFLLKFVVEGTKKRVTQNVRKQNPTFTIYYFFIFFSYFLYSYFPDSTLLWLSRVACHLHCTLTGNGKIPSSSHMSCKHICKSPTFGKQTLESMFSLPLPIILKRGRNRGMFRECKLLLQVKCANLKFINKGQKPPTLYSVFSSPTSRLRHSLYWLSWTTILCQQRMHFFLTFKNWLAPNILMMLPHFRYIFQFGSST